MNWNKDVVLPATNLATREIPV